MCFALMQLMYFKMYYIIYYPLKNAIIITNFLSQLDKLLAENCQMIILVDVCVIQL